MRPKALPKRLLQVSLIIWLPLLSLALILLLPQVAYAGGEVTDCSNDLDLHAKLAGGGLVTFNCGSAPVTITLTTTDLPRSHIHITQTTTISGGGLITLRGNGAARIFHVDGSSLNLEGLGITRGRALIGPNPNDFGGAIYIANGGAVNVTDSTLFDNQAQFGGAVGVSTGSVTVTNSSLFDNRALFGGALYVADLAPGSPPANTMTIVNSAVISNTATDGDGGAIRVWDSTLTVANSTLSNNHAVEIVGEGFAGGDGGAIGVGGTAAGDFSLTLITNTTIYSNSAAINGGGVHIDSGTGSGLVKNSIIANNTASVGANCSNLNLVSAGNNLAGDGSCNFNASGDLTNTDPLLGPLAVNGGDTLTHAPLPGSPAINAADNSACAAPPVSGVDQRGVSRPQGATCDIGAVEATANLSLAKSSTSEGGNLVRPTERVTYTIVVTNSGELTTTNVSISDTTPANTTFVPGSISLTPQGAGTPGTAPPTLVSNMTIAPDQHIFVAFAVTVNAPLPDGTLITNTASVSSTEMLSPVSGSVTDTVTNAPNLNIWKGSQDANGGLLVPGDTITYTIVVTNSGTADATGALISDTLPANTAFVPGSISLNPPGAGTPGTTLPALVSNLMIAPNQAVTAAFAVTVNLPLPDGTVIKNTASVTSNETPSPVSSSVADAVTSSPSLAIAKSFQDANGGLLAPGDTITYTIVVTNSGTAVASGTLISDTLPANTTFVPNSINLTPPGAGTPGLVPPVLASDLIIAPDQPTIVAFAATVNKPLDAGTIITNTASVASIEVPVPKTDSVTGTVSTTPAINVAKDGPSNAGVDETVIYTFTVTNVGDTLLEDVQVVDDYAGPGNFVSGDDGDLKLGLTEAWIYTASYTILPSDPDPLTNTVSVTATDALNTQTTNTDQHRTNLSEPIFLPIIMKDFRP